MFMCGQLAEALKEHLANQARALLSGCQGLPVLFAYSSDATSLLCQAVVTHKEAEGVVLRRGKVLMELLMQRGYLKTVSAAGQENIALLITNPLPLTAGKKTSNLFTAAASFWPLLRRCGHQGLCIYHLEADRACLSSLDRLLRQRHSGYYTAGLGPELGNNAVLLELTDWFVSTGCAAHDCHNSIKWSLERSAGGDTTKDLHIVVESLRNSFKLLNARLVSFLQSKLSFYDTSSDDVEAVEAFWHTLGVGEDKLPLVVELNPKWEDGRLWVSDTFQDREDATDKISGLLLYVFKWKKFVESRWCTIAPSCRALLCSLCCGLEGLVAVTRAQKGATDYHLHGFAKLTTNIKKFCCVATVTGQVSDTLLLDILDDDRVLKHLPKLEACVSEELKWAHNISEYTWERLAMAVGADWHAGEVRSEALHACHVSAAYIKNKVFTVARSLPFSLALGDVKDNLAKLKASDEPIRDSCAHKIRELLRVGFDSQAIEDGVMLLREINWTTVPVEQAHGSCAVLHRMHPTYTAETLVFRALVHNCRDLFAIDPEERRLAKKHAQLEALKRKQPEKVSGKHAFLAASLKAAKGLLPPGSKMQKTQTNQVVKQHSAAFDALPQASRAAWRLTARAEGARRKAALQATIQDFEENMSLQQKRRVWASDAKGLMNRHSMARFADDDLKALMAILATESYSTKVSVDAKKGLALAPPEVPPSDVVHAFARVPIYAAPKPARAVPEWVRTVCLQRVHFRGAVLLGSCEPGSLAYYVLYATQTPYQVTLIPVTYDPPILPALGDLSFEDYVAGWEDWCEHRFVFQQRGAFVTDEQVVLLPDQLLVLPGAFLRPQWDVAADGSPIAFQDFVEDLPPLPPRKRKAEEEAEEAAAGAADPELPLLEEQPWGEGMEEEQPEAAADPEEADADPGAAADPTLRSAFLDSLWAEMAERRAQWADEEQVKGDDFDVQMLGDRWTEDLRHKAFDSIIGLARASAKPWCKIYGLSTKTYYSIKLYTESGATLMAQEWCDRMQHFYDIWKAQGDAQYTFSEDDSTMYVEGETWLAFCGQEAMSAQLYERVAAIRCIAPGAPVGASSND